MHLLVRPPPPAPPETEYEMRPVGVWTNDRFPVQKRPPTHLRAVAARRVKTVRYNRSLCAMVSGPCLTRCADAGRLCEGAAGEGQEWGRQARWGGRRRLGAIRNQ